MRRIRALPTRGGGWVVAAALVAALMGGCGGSTRSVAAGTPGADRAPAPTSATTSTPTSSSAQSSAPESSPAATSAGVHHRIAPPIPTVPADVPRTGPNLRRPGEQPPVLPLEATQHTARGAEAFARFFLETIDWGYATTSSAYMAHYSSPACTVCRGIREAIQSTGRQRRHYIGDRFTINAALVDGHASSVSVASASVTTRFDITSSEVVDSHGRFVSGTPAISNFKEQLLLTWAQDHWVVSQMAIVQ